MEWGRVLEITSAILFGTERVAHKVAVACLWGTISKERDGGSPSNLFGRGIATVGGNSTPLGIFMPNLTVPSQFLLT